MRLLLKLQVGNRELQDITRNGDRGKLVIVYPLYRRSQHPWKLDFIIFPTNLKLDICRDQSWCSTPGSHGRLATSPWKYDTVW